MFNLSFTPIKSNSPERFFPRGIPPRFLLHGMTLDASSHATLAMSSGGGVAVRAYDGNMSMVRRVGEVSSTVSWALPGKTDHTLYWS